MSLRPDAADAALSASLDAGAVGDGGDAASPTHCGQGANLVVGVGVVEVGSDAGLSSPCAAGNVLEADEQVTGLDYLGGGSRGTLAGESVTSCIGVRFDDQLQFFRVIARASGNACGGACALDGGCGSGRTGFVFAGAEVTTLRFVESLTVTDVLDAATFVAQASDRIVVVCRGSYIRERDDIAVDAILGQCR